MKQSVSRRPLAMLVTLALFAGAQSAIAEPPAPSPVGAWTFTTSKMMEGCVLSGDMTITRKADKTMACEFKAKWACELVAPRSVETEQTCTAKQTGDSVIITSRIKKIGKVVPAEFADYMRVNYAADHFRVTINALGDRMDGLFHSYGQASVIFRKHLELIG